ISPASARASALVTLSPMQSSIKVTGRFRCAASPSAMGRSDMSGTTFPFGRPKWLSRRTFAPFCDSSFRVGRMRSMRVKSEMFPSSTGTFISTRAITVLPFASRSSSVLNSAILSLRSFASVGVRHGDCGVAHPVGEAPLVIVPAQHTHEGAVNHLRLGQIEGGGGRGVVEVDGDDRIAVDLENTLQAAVCGLPDGVVDLVNRGCARGNEGKINHRNVRRRHTDRGAVELAGKFRKHEANGLRRTGRGRDDRHCGGARPAQVAVQGVENRLVACIGMHRRHEAMHETDAFVQDLGYRRKAVGGAGGVGDNGVLLLQLVVVDAVNNGEVNVGARGGDENLLRAGFQMLCRRIALGEDTGAFERDIDAELAPRQFGRVANGGHLDRAAAKIDAVTLYRHGAGVAAMHAVIFQEMGVRLDRPEVVDADNLDIGPTRLVDCPQDIPSNPSKSVDCNTNSHFSLLLLADDVALAASVFMNNLY